MEKRELRHRAFPVDGLHEGDIQGHLFALKVRGRGQKVFRRALGIRRMEQRSQSGKEDRQEQVSNVHNKG